MMSEPGPANFFLVFQNSFTMWKGYLYWIIFNSRSSWISPSQFSKSDWWSCKSQILMGYIPVVKLLLLVWWMNCEINTILNYH